MKTDRTMHVVAGVALGFWMILLSGVAGAETVYVADMREISKRAGPSTEYRILRMLPTGAEMEVLSEQAGWLRVRSPDGVEGWVLKRLTSPEVPAVRRYAELRQEFDALYAASSGALGRIAELEEVNQNLMDTLSETSNKLLDLDREYTAFKQDAAEVADLRQRYDVTAKELEALQTEAGRLREENTQLKSGDRFRWFLVGGGVFLVAWLAGVITGRMQRKLRKTLQYS